MADALTLESSATQMIMHRTRISEDDAAYYVNLAEMRIRDFLGLGESSPLDSYLFGIVDIATLMYQADTATKNSESSLGFKSESMSEGGVSKSCTAYTGSEIRETYETEIRNVLESLVNDAGKVVFI